MEYKVMISDIGHIVKSYFKYLNRLRKGDYTPISIASFGITSLVVIENSYICGLADEAIIDNDLYFLLIDTYDPQEVMIMKHGEENGENGLSRVRNGDEFDRVWEYFTNPYREKCEIMQNLIYFWEHGEVGARNEMSVIKYLFQSFGLSAAIFLWFHVFNLSNMQVLLGEVLLSSKKSEMLFFVIGIIIIATATLLTVKNNRRIGTVWSNTLIAVGLALTTKLTGWFAGIAIILLAGWILLTVLCSININHSIKTTHIEENNRVIIRRKKCILRMSRNVLTIASIILLTLFLITLL